MRGTSSISDVFAAGWERRFSRNGFKVAFARKTDSVARRPRVDPEKACTAAVETCAGYNLRRTSRVVTSLFDCALEPTGLRSTQVAILQMIVVTDAPSIARLARQMAMDPSTLTRNLRPLVREGYVELVKAPRGRAKVAHLTDQGRAKLDEVMQRWREAQAVFVKRFGAKRWRLLRNELLAVVAALQ